MFRASVGFVLCAGLAAPAAAGPYSDVPSAADPEDPFDVHGRVDYAFELERGAIRRERAGAPGTDPTGAVPEVDDLLIEGSRHVLTPAVELGVFHDAWIAAALPIVIAHRRELKLDVDRAASSTIVDGLLPPEGFDVDDPVGFPPSEDTIFRGPRRSGLDQIHLGIGYAPMNQQRDDTKPTWKLEAQLRIPVGAIARFDRDDPGRNTAVGRGVYEILLQTSVARRIGWAEPFFALSWLAPLSVKSGSTFEDPGFGARATRPQQQAGVHFGVEAIIVDRPEDPTRVGIELSSHVNARFEGRDYSPMWEVFAYAGDVGHSGPLVLDHDPTASGLQAVSHPGITDVENYLELAARGAVRAELGPHVHVAALVTVQTATKHVISFDDAGHDLPTCEGSSRSDCEVESNDVINGGSAEVNPLHVPLIGTVGHRYIADDNLAIAIGVETKILF